MTAFKTLAKDWANKLLEPMGHAIEYTTRIPSFDRFAAVLDRNGLTPKTVFDIGVQDGTPWLYEKWPGATFHLFDPLPEALPHMQNWARKINATVHNIALGDAPGELEMRIRENDLSGSTVFQANWPASKVRVQKVPVDRFDNVMAGGFERPAVAKIDVQGAEMMVLGGMTGSLKSLDALIIEIGVFQLLPGAPDAADVIASLKKQGFVMYDIVGFIRRPLDRALSYIDAVFVPADSALRRDQRWTETE